VNRGTASAVSQKADGWHGDEQREVDGGHENEQRGADESQEDE
jgi:hypothetical protein